MRKHISQREAVRTRRELRRLREFVDAIRGGRSDYHAHVVTLDLQDHAWSHRLEGMMLGAQHRGVALADFPERTKLRVTFIRTPERDV